MVYTGKLEQVHADESGADFLYYGRITFSFEEWSKDGIDDLIDKRIEELRIKLKEKVKSNGNRSQ